MRIGYVLSVRSYHRACNQFSDYCPADLDSGNVFWFPVHLEIGTGNLGYLSDYQEHFYKKLRRINNNGKHL